MNNLLRVTESWRKGNLAILVANELRQRRWTALWWTVGILAFITLNLSVYPAFRNQAAEIDQSLRHIPASAKALFTDTGDFLSPVGYLSSQVYYLLLPLLFSFLAMSLGSSLIAREESQRTIELLLARPVSRTKLLFGKAIAGLVLLSAVGVTLAIAGGLEVALIQFKGVTFGNVLLTTLMAMILAILFGTIAFALTAVGRSGRAISVGIAVLIALASYIISSLDQTVDWLRWPAKLLPFHYYRPADILQGHFTLGAAIGMLAATGVLMLCAWLAFRRRDIN